MDSTQPSAADPASSTDLLRDAALDEVLNHLLGGSRPSIQQLTDELITKIEPALAADAIPDAVVLAAAISRAAFVLAGLDGMMRDTARQEGAAVDSLLDGIHGVIHDFMDVYGSPAGFRDDLVLLLEGALGLIDGAKLTSTSAES